MKVQFAIIAFWLLLFEYRSVLSHAQRIPDRERVRFLGKKMKKVDFLNFM